MQRPFEFCAHEVHKDYFGPFKTHLKLFEGLDYRKPYSILIKADVIPKSITVPRRVSIPLKDTVYKELLSMNAKGIIEPVNEPTDWCSGLVVVNKPNGKVRLCEFGKIE